MARCLLAANNWVEADYYGDTIFTGGSWESALPLTNLADQALVNVAQSTDALAASTKFYFDLRALRSVRLTYIPTHNCQRNANYRIRYSDTAQFTGCVVNANTLAGVSSIVFRAGASGVTITTGDHFTIAGDSEVYKATNTVSISAGGTGTVNITPNLATNASIDAEITCHTGNFTTPTRDSGTKAVFPPVYDTTTLTWFDEHQWDGKYTDEEIARIKMPIIDVSTTPFFARYGLIEITDTTNTDGYIWLSYLFTALGYIPSINPIYGLRQGFVSNTRINTSLGDAEFFEVRGSRRTFNFEINDISQDEALSNSYEIIQFSDIYRPVVFVFDPEDTIHLHRRAMLARFQSMGDLSYAYFDAINTPYSLIEKIA